MALKLPKDVIEELDQLMEKLSKGDSDERQLASARLAGYESSGKISLEAILDMADDQNPSIALYAMQALARNKSASAVKKLVSLARQEQKGNLIMLESIIDAIGETGDQSAASILFELMGVKFGTMAKLKGKLPGKKAQETKEDKNRRAHLTLPVVRALSNMHDSRVAEKLGEFLGHPDSLVRWHAIQGLIKSRVMNFNEQLKVMAEQEDNDIVREACEIALYELNPLPDNQNN